MYTPDYVLIVLTAIFLVFGLIMIFDASIYNADQLFDDRFYFVKQQAVWIFLGVAAGAVAYFWDYHSFSKVAVPLMGVTVMLLVMVLIFGEEINGSKRWFYIGGIPLQPAELAKPAFILYLSTWLSKTRDKKSFKTFKEALRYHFVYELLVFLVLLAVVGGLIVVEPDLGTAVVICVVAFAIYFSSGRDAIHTLGSILIGVVGGLLGLGAILLESYRLERVRTFGELLLTGEVADPLGSGYQVQQILIGIGSGGFWGKGFGESRQRFGYLVENTAFTDSIYAIILEELGMIGGMILVVLFLLLLSRAFRIAKRAPDKLGQLLAGGIGFWLVFQAFLHMAANVALVPVTGVPLTFFTYGGSSLVVTLVGMGILLNVSRHVET
jgi:cell division protein FtsW